MVKLKNRKKMWGVVILAGVGFALGGCASKGPYQEPQDGPVASMRYVTAPDKFLIMLSTVDLQECKPSGYVGFLSGGSKPDANRTGMIASEPPRDGILERRVRANERFAIVPNLAAAQVGAGEILFGLTPWMQADIQGRQPGACRIPVLVAEPNGEYEMAIAMTRGACAVKLEKLSRSASGEVQRQEIKGAAEGYVDVLPPLVRSTLKCSL